MKPANPFLADALALVAGLLLPLAFAPAGVFPVAFLSPLMLMLAWRTGTPRRAFLRGWLYGAGSFGIGVSWIHESFRFNDIGLGVAIPLTVAVVAFLALDPALLGFALRRAPATSETQRMLLLFPAAWVLVEWLRGWLFTGFTWLQLGYSQVDSPLAGFLPVAGVYGVGWLVALCAALIGVALSAGSR
ncbi:MAG: apolipoprotein N-acyltransferase, partial [Gammaproteobacteria bacterium]|nr:apolipoprotein N-acyltransferase [Gammaproteobacteria bacterium]